MNLGEAIALAGTHQAELNPNRTITNRDVTDHIRTYVQETDIPVLVDNANVREAYRMILRASSNDVNRELGRG